MLKVEGAFRWFRCAGVQTNGQATPSYCIWAFEEQRAGQDSVALSLQDTGTAILARDEFHTQEINSFVKRGHSFRCSTFVLTGARIAVLPLQRMVGRQTFDLATAIAIR
ncbi:hypothetical protein [Candidatus Methylomirabilis sp.]|uniref:hypothetical protein n=1 Tax=Candidatus Methylomirabilis sp. TaxID=2032687 RepID=UPI003C75BA6A